MDVITANNYRKDVISQSTLTLLTVLSVMSFGNTFRNKGFSGSSCGEEFVCNAGDPGSISGSGRSPGDEIGYHLQYSWAS